MGLSVRSITQNDKVGFLMTYSAEVGNGPRDDRLSFGVDPDHCLTSGSVLNSSQLIITQGGNCDDFQVPQNDSKLTFDSTETI